MLYRASVYSVFEGRAQECSYLANSDVAALKKARAWVKDVNKIAHSRFRLTQVVLIIHDAMPEKVREVSLRGRAS